MPARSDVFGSPGVLEEDDLPSISDTIRYAGISKTTEEEGVFLLILLVRVKLLFLWLTSENIFSSVSVQEVKTAVLEKWSSAAPCSLHHLH